MRDYRGGSNAVTQSRDGRPQDAVFRAQLDQDALSELRAVLGKDFRVLVDTWVADSKVRLQLLQVALAGQDAVALREAAHALKGSSLNLGALRLGDLCLAMESAARAGELGRAPALLAAIDAEYRQVAPLLARIAHD